MVAPKKERDDFLHPKVDTRSMKAKEEHDKSKKKLTNGSGKKAKTIWKWQ
jgi:hypothetical protein